MAQFCTAVPTFIAQYDPATRKVPKIAADIAVRLLAAGRAGDALGFLERSEFRDRAWVPAEWQAARLDVLEALGRADEAQAFRLACFQRSLAADHLRAYLKRLADFDDVEAEDQAMIYAMSYPAVLSALHFLINWPAPDRAAKLVDIRHNQHGERAHTIVVGYERVLHRRRWRAVEVLACPVTWRPHPEQIASARQGYEDWWQALSWVRDGLIVGGMLRGVEVTGVMPKVQPWDKRVTSTKSANLL